MVPAKTICIVFSYKSRTLIDYVTKKYIGKRKGSLSLRKNSSEHVYKIK